MSYLHSDSTNRNDDDLKTIAIDIDIDNNSSNIIKDKQENQETCKCGDPSLHKYECALYCGMSPCEDKLVKLPKCVHMLHESCLQRLLFIRLSKCPLCRSSIDCWRRSKHYHRIEEEITQQFQSDTQQAILLSQKTFEKEEKRKSRSRHNEANNNDSESDRDRSRSRSRERNSNNNNNNDNIGNNDRDRNSNNTARFRSTNTNNNNNRRHSS